MSTAAERPTDASTDTHAASRMRRVAIIGGGISGLAAAHRLTEIAPHLDVTLFEASARLGGVLETVHREGFLIERSADGFITNLPWGIDLARRVGLEPHLLQTTAGKRQAFVVHEGQLCKIPAGFTVLAPSRLGPILTTPLLSLRGKLRLWAERIVPRRASAGSSLVDESLANFARRRLGREAYERLAQPLVGGIYTADPEKLSLAATMPRFLQMERDHGSLWRGARAEQSAASSASTASPESGTTSNTANADAIILHDQTQPSTDSGARYSMFVAPREGMSALIDAVRARLPHSVVRLNSAINAIERTASAWRLTIAGAYGGAATIESFDDLIIATPAHQAAKLLKPVDPSLSADLAAIEHASIAVVSLAYDRDQIKHPLDGFGYVTPLIAKRSVLSGSFASVKYSGRAPDGKVLIRAFIGGACQAELLQHSDTDLRHLAHDDVAHLLGVAGPPSLALVNRWSDAMPQYHLGHLERVARIEAQAAALSNLAICGNAYRGVGIPQCIRSGERAAEQIQSRQHVEVPASAAN